MNKLLENAKGVIFDVDGLLINSEPLWQLTRDEFFKKRGLVYDKSVDPKVIGRGIPDIMQFWKEYFGISGDVLELTKEYRALFYELALLSQKLRLMMGAEELVKKLFDDGKILAIATGGHTKEKMKDVLKAFDLEKYFSHIVSSDEIAKGKPEPDIFLHTIALLHLPGEKCVILEDAANGVDAAKRAGIPVIAVQKQQEMIDRITPFHPNELVDSLENLL